MESLSIGKLIDQAIKEKGLTHTRAAVFLGVHSQYLTQVKRGDRRITNQFADRLGALFGPKYNVHVWRIAQAQEDLRLEREFAANGAADLKVLEVT